MELEKWLSEECLWYEQKNLNLNPRTHTINAPCMTVCDYNANIEEQRQVVSWELPGQPTWEK